MFYLDRRQKRPSKKIAVTALYAILLLFAGFLDQLTIFSIRTFSNARYHLFGQVTKVSLG